LSCEGCGKDGEIVRLTKVVGGKVERRRLCRPCAAANGFVIEPEAFTPAPTQLPAAVNQFIGKMMEALESGLKIAEAKGEPARPCGECGITPGEFQKRGRLGCPHDYVAFEEDLDRLLLKIHGKNVHVGAAPARAKERQGRRRFVRERLEALKKELDGAVKAERFEEAANLRDRLKELERVGDDGS
jgi:protein arginine kinase activator